MDRAMFEDRADAGRALGRALEHLRERDPIVLALPRGGVPVAVEVARALGADLFVLVVRKLGVPGQEELAFGAIASGGIRVIDREIVARAHLDDAAIEAISAREAAEVERRRAAYGAAPPALRDRCVIIVDDGLATGSTMRAAARAVAAAGPARLVIGVPVASPDVCSAMMAEADEVVCVRTPTDLVSVGSWFRDFSQVGDDDVRAHLDRGAR